MKRGDLIKYKETCRWAHRNPIMPFALVMRVDKAVYCDEHGRTTNRIVLRRLDGSKNYEPQSVLEVVAEA